LSDSACIDPTYGKPFDLIFQRVKKEEWLPFVDTYRTFCFAPGPKAKEILLGIQQFTPRSALRHRDGALFAP